ncbi:MAG: SusD/RagB family nutrient-binding outer membrane lipoprotein [Tannerellaceae bacterium]|jgi:hypothetical protein|nr:SusD/RagB family nutrient-binding outer membrane lipoprotein [Tannerellaceae bacterium]
MSTIVKVYMRYLLAFLAVVLASCTTGFEEYNAPKTSSITVDPGFVLAKVQRNSKFYQGLEYRNCTFGSWIQHWNSTTNNPTSRYLFAHESWGSYYNWILNISQIRNHLLKGQENSPEGRSKLAIARIVEVDLWQTITDMWGDIPFSESALGSLNLIVQPKYDTQEEIYNTLIATIDEAIASLTVSDASYGSNDLYYKGNVEQWIKYGNSVKLQLGMRLKYVKPDLAQKVVSEALNAPLIADNSDNAMVATNMDYTESYHPTVRQFLLASQDNRYLAEAFVNQLVDTHDPRLTYLVHPTANSIKSEGDPVYRGKVVAGTDEELVGIINDDYSTPSETYFGLSYNQLNPLPYYVYTYSEVCFYKAEAAIEGWGGLTEGQAEGFYQEGIKAALALEPFKITDIPQDFINAVFSLSGLTPEQKLEKIMTQKWIVLFCRSTDAFAEWRRTGYPRLTPGNNKGSTDGQIPRRAGYPNDEMLLNTENYEEAVKRMSDGDSYISRVWWDTKRF